MQQGIFFIQDLALVLVVAAAAGWVCQRLGLSVVVGYLMAGMLIVLHPFTDPMLDDPGRIERLSQMGLVFLMFGIGLRLSLRKLRRLGFLLLLAVFASAGTIYYLTRMVASGVLGWSGTESLFLAGMLMVSSSAIINKVLQESGGGHERAEQTAMGVVVLEDVVAVIMLAFLTASTHMAELRVGHTLGVFFAFVVLLGVAGLLFVPWLLRKLSVTASEELQTVGVAGLLLGLAWLAHMAGYSLALGAFLLGLIVGETPQRTQLDRAFEGMRDVFSSVFFVAIGLQINPYLLLDSWGLILGIAVLTIVVRVFAVTVGLSLIGTRLGESLQAALMVTPIGEFSFIIAQVGVTAAVVPQKFYPLAVGVSLLTTLSAPFLTRNSHTISVRILHLLPKWVGEWHAYYCTQLERLKAEQKRSMLWQLSRKRFVQLVVEMLLVTGLLVFSRPLSELVVKALGEDRFFEGGPLVLFWLVMVVVVLAPVVALWRNVSALCLLYAQVVVPRGPQSDRLSRVVELAFKMAAGTVLAMWLMTLLPSVPGMRWLLPLSVLVAGWLLFLLRRRLVYWHSEMEVELQSMLHGAGQAGVDTSAPWLGSHDDDWGIHASSCMLPDLAACQGQRIAELNLRARFGCVVAGIERQGCLILRPGPGEMLYPRDKVLLIGTNEQVDAGKKFLLKVSGHPPSSAFDDARMDTLIVPVGSRAAGYDLRTLLPAQVHHVQIAGIHRGGRRILNPGGTEVLEAGDELLVIGTPDEIGAFKDWLAAAQEGQVSGGLAVM